MEIAFIYPAWHKIKTLSESPPMSVSRRTLVSQSAAAAITVSLPLAACSDKAAKNSASISNPAQSPDLEKSSLEKSAKTFLDQATELMLKAYPESASSAGIDKGK